MKILIPNASNKQNIGDLAILETMIDMLRHNFGHPEILVHCYNPESFSYKDAARYEGSLYYWAVFEFKDLFTRSGRMIQWILGYISVQYNIPVLCSQKVRQLLQDYQQSDLIFLAGGGYLRAQKGSTQALNLLMQLFMIHCTTSLNKNVINAPFSIGPFAYTWQKKLTANVLRKVNLLTLRESQSAQLMSTFQLPNIVMSHDFAFLPSLNVPITASAQKIVGYTVKQQSTKILNEMADALIKFSQRYSYVVSPILQVDSPEYGEGDLVPTKYIQDRLGRAGVNVTDVIRLSSVAQGLEEYGKLSLLLGMRLHSALLAMVSGVPAVTIAYEHKTTGIMEELGMSRYCCNIMQARQAHVYSLLEDLHINIQNVRMDLQRQLSNIRSQEKIKWEGILKKYV